MPVFIPGAGVVRNSHQRRWWLTAVLLWAAGGAVAWAQSPAFPPDHHPWGRFPLGSWKLVRVTSETLDAQGHVTNVTTTETKTTLVASDLNSYTLRVDVTVEVAGRRFASAPQTVKHGYYGESPGQTVSVKELGNSQLTLDGRMVACELRQAVVETEGVKRVSMIHYSDTVPPYQLRRETTAEGASEDKRASTLVEIVALDLPQRVVDEVKQATYVKTTNKQAQGTKVTLEVQCDDVPGGVVSHWSSETDAASKVVRRSTLELVDYEITEAKKGEISYGRRRGFHRRAARRMN
jgi:hypothetical protein